MRCKKSGKGVVNCQDLTRGSAASSKFFWKNFCWPVPLQLRSSFFAEALPFTLEKASSSPHTHTHAQAPPPKSRIVWLLRACVDLSSSAFCLLLLFLLASLCLSYWWHCEKYCGHSLWEMKIYCEQVSPSLLSYSAISREGSSITPVK